MLEEKKRVWCQINSWLFTYAQNFYLLKIHLNSFEIPNRVLKFKDLIRMYLKAFYPVWKFISNMDIKPSSIYSCSIGHILEHDFCHLGCWAVKGKFLKRPNFCLSMLLFWPIFSTFCAQKINFQIFFLFFSVRVQKLLNKKLKKKKKKILKQFFFGQK